MTGFYIYTCPSTCVYNCVRSIENNNVFGTKSKSMFLKLTFFVLTLQKEHIKSLMCFDKAPHSVFWILQPDTDTNALQSCFQRVRQQCYQYVYCVIVFSKLVTSTLARVYQIFVCYNNHMWPINRNISTCIAYVKILPDI